MTSYEAYECMKRAASEHAGRKVRNADVARGVGMDTARLSDWKLGKSEPKLDKIYKICKYFGVSIDTFCELVYEDN